MEWHPHEEDFVDLGDHRALLACRARVESHDVAWQYLLGLATDDRFADVALAELIPALALESGGTKAVLVTESEEGSAIVTVGPDTESEAAQVAAAVAVMRASWGWDERSTILVCINGVAWNAAPRYNGEHWTAVVTAQGSVTCQ